MLIYVGFSTRHSAVLTSAAIAELLWLRMGARPVSARP